jgi:hypothetical protein
LSTGLCLYRDKSVNKENVHFLSIGERNPSRDQPKLSKGLYTNGGEEPKATKHFIDRYKRFTSNFSSMDLREVLVLITQRSPSLDTSMTGEETVAAFLSRKFTSRAFRNSSYFSAEVRSYLPTKESMAMYPKQKGINTRKLRTHLLQLISKIKSVIRDLSKSKVSTAIA